MNKTNILLPGERVYENFLADLSHVIYHDYDNIDELIMMYTDWCKLGEVFVNRYSRQIYPVVPGSAREEQEEAEDNMIALRNAMINFYCAIDRMTPGLDRRKVVHAAYSQEECTLIVVVR